MIIWMLLIVATLIGAYSAALTAANREAAQAAREATQRYGVAGVHAGCVIALLTLIAIALWTWYAIDVRDWRFAAIAWIPFLLNLVSRTVSDPKRRPLR